MAYPLSRSRQDVAKIGRYRTNAIDVFDYIFALCVEWVPRYCVRHLMIGFDEIGAQGGAVVDVPSNFFGLAACLFGQRCYFVECRVWRERERSKNKLNDKFALLDHLANSAFNPEYHHRAA